MSPASGRIPEVGEVLPLLVNNKKVKVERYEGPGNHKAVLVDVKSGNLVGTLSSRKLWDWMAGTAQKLRFPTLYSTKNAEEHFCEALALKAFGRLGEDHMKAFNRFVLGEKETPEKVKLAVSGVWYHGSHVRGLSVLIPSTEGINLLGV